MRNDPQEPSLSPKQNSTRGIHALIWGTTALLLGLIWFATEYQIGEEREIELQAVNRHTLNLVRVFEEHVVRTLKGTEQTIALIKEQVESGRLRGVPLALGQKAVLDGFGSGVPLFHQIGITDEKGNYRDSTSPMGHPVNVADRQHFQVHKEQDSGELLSASPCWHG